MRNGLSNTPLPACTPPSLHDVSFVRIIWPTCSLINMSSPSLKQFNFINMQNARVVYLLGIVSVQNTHTHTYHNIVPKMPISDTTSHSVMLSSTL